MMASGVVGRRWGGFARLRSRALLLALVALSVVSLSLDTPGGAAAEAIGDVSVPGVEEGEEEVKLPESVPADGEVAEAEEEGNGGAKEGEGGEKGGGELDVDGGKEMEETFIPPMPSDAVVNNFLEDLELKNLEEERRKLPPDMRAALPPELWGSTDIKKYKRALKTIEKGQKVLNTAGKMASFGGLLFSDHSPASHDSRLMIAGIIGMLLAGILAVPPAIAGAIHRAVGRRRLKKVKAQLKKKHELIKKRAEAMSFDVIDNKGLLDQGRTEKPSDSS